MSEWIEGAPVAVTVCDAEGRITAMNARAVAVFAKYGGRELVGASVLDCHPEPARTKLSGMLQKRSVNAYTIEKSGVKKLIYQFSFGTGERPAGLVELSLELPPDMPHFVRKG